MFFNKNAQNLIAALNDLHEEMAGIKADFGEFQQQIRQEIDSIKQDYRDLILFLEEDNADNSPDPAGKSPDTAVPSPAEAEADPAAAGNGSELTAVVDEIQKLQQNVVAVQDDVGRLAGDIDDRVTGIEKQVKSEMKTLGRRIEDAKRDIKNKISYTVGRMKV